MKNIVLLKNNIVENIVVVDDTTPMEMFSDYTVMDMSEGADIGRVFVSGATHQFQPQNPNDGTTYREDLNQYMSDEDYTQATTKVSEPKPQ